MSSRQQQQPSHHPSQQLHFKPAAAALQYICHRSFVHQIQGEEDLSRRSFAFQYSPCAIMDLLGKKERRGRDVKGTLKRNWLLLATITSVILGKICALVR